MHGVVVNSSERVVDGTRQSGLGLEYVLHDTKHCHVSSDSILPIFQSSPPHPFSRKALLEGKTRARRGYRNRIVIRRAGPAVLCSHA